MGAQVRYGTIAIGAYMAHQPGTHQVAFRDHYYPKWDRGGARSPRTWQDKNRWYSLWSYGCRIGYGAPSGSDGVSSNRDLTTPDLFEPYSCDGEGTQSKRFIKGTCVDASDVPVANAIVQGYVTSTDAYVGEVQANNDGTYTLGTETLPGVAHYLVAYKPGSPDIAGTTVNTLTSTHVDGS
jgi:hypothetical protein